MYLSYWLSNFNLYCLVLPCFCLFCKVGDSFESAIHIAGNQLQMLRVTGVVLFTISPIGLQLVPKDTHWIELMCKGLWVRLWCMQHKSLLSLLVHTSAYSRLIRKKMKPRPTNYKGSSSPNKHPFRSSSLTKVFKARSSIFAEESTTGVR